MEIGISALLFNLDEALKICKKEKEITHIELGLDNLDEYIELEKYKDEIQNLGLSMGIHLPMELNTCENISFIRDSWVEFIERMNENLKDYNVKYYNLHLGYAMTNRVKNNKDLYLDNSVDFFNKITLDEDKFISIENTYTKDGDFSNIGNKVYDFEYIFSKLKLNNVCFCYDTGHFLIDNDDYLDKLSNKISVVHLSDNDGINDFHLGIGKGVLSLKHLKDTLSLNPKYLVLEVQFNHIKDTIDKIKSTNKGV